MKIKNRLRQSIASRKGSWARFLWNPYIAVITAIVFLACVGPSRERATKEAIQNVKETMDVALPDLAHPEPYKYSDSGDCAWIPEMTSSKETLRYQVEVPLPAGDNGLDRQTRAVQYWIDKGGKIRTPPYQNGPPSEVDYRGGSILAFAMPIRGRTQDPRVPATFYIVATTPCVPKED